MIGHSWGGDTIAKAAAEVPGRVHALITIDPVSDPENRPKFETVRNSVRIWVNVNAKGDPDGSILRGILQGNFAAFFGRAWNNGPEGFADIYINAPHNHSSFTNMMFYAPNGGKSPQDIINE